ncbi:dihydroorotase [Natronococcus occultus]|uniref:Dihydroorotase-like cyclic amidohydrolase n=1 Tax=Natronococcus occultus SP4 TaxID=694430 RepID=L0K2X1_9EURY|nr:amidohydrolase family protein [Natronococcus occultus]AGB38890.1 dihydroorotase-like cyclic amidohydrolase [Natronococcus occultus SP4]
MSRLDTLITGGTVVTADSTFDAAIGIDDGTIIGVGDERAFPAAEQRIDVNGNLVLPGVVDPHVHLAGYNSIDSYETGTAAAAAGGVTSLVTFAWQGWDDGEWDENGSIADAVERHRSQASPLIDYGLHPVITRESPTVFEELPGLVEDGITSFKMFTTDDIRLSNGFIGDVFRRLADLGAVGMVHTEDYSVCQSRTDELKSSPTTASATMYPQSRPDYAEAMAVDSIARLAVAADAKYYAVHVTSKAAAETVDTVQTDGSNVRAETCTHYTVLDETAYEQFGNLAIMSPPLRKAEDVDALFDWLRDRTLSVVSTDHVPLPRKRKSEGPWWESAFGVNSLQTSLPVFHDEAVNKRGLSYQSLVQLLSRNPARTFGLSSKGRIETGADADLVVFDPDETYTITAARNHSNADYSVYEDRTVTGRVKKTLVRGELVAEDGTIVAEPGYGQFVARDVPTWSQS